MAASSLERTAGEAELSAELGSVSEVLQAHIRNSWGCLDPTLRDFHFISLNFGMFSSLGRNLNVQPRNDSKKVKGTLRNVRMWGTLPIWGGGCRDGERIREELA